MQQSFFFIIILKTVAADISRIQTHAAILLRFIRVNLKGPVSNKGSSQRPFILIYKTAVDDV